MRECLTAELEKRDKGRRKGRSLLRVRLSRVHFEVEQDHVTTAMTLDWETSGRARLKCHNLCLSWNDCRFNVVPV
jgi:hypothetical protein